ncbi:MAG: hypothetical protein ACLRWP_17935 [Bilophila wadsworthia]
MKFFPPSVSTAATSRPKVLEEALLNPDVLIRLATRLKEERGPRAG